MADEEDLQKFLKNVDEITSLIQEMNSDDPRIQQKAILETEQRLLYTEEVPEEDGCRTTLNKTTINRSQAPMENADEINSEAFLASMELDAKERARRRRENRVLADGNCQSSLFKSRDDLCKKDHESAC
uniref:Tetratricopeptide repeat domain 12 n=1 Tax=Canis lupus dingo TaxID=286419 RepID=A0A8C0JW91_CANLU